MEPNSLGGENAKDTSSENEKIQELTESYEKLSIASTEYSIVCGKIAQSMKHYVEGGSSQLMTELDKATQEYVSELEKSGRQDEVKKIITNSSLMKHLIAERD